MAESTTKHIWEDDVFRALDDDSDWSNEMWLAALRTWESYPIFFHRNIDFCKIPFAERSLIVTVDGEEKLVPLQDRSSPSVDMQITRTGSEEPIQLGQYRAWIMKEDFEPKKFGIRLLRFAFGRANFHCLVDVRRPDSLVFSCPPEVAAVLEMHRFILPSLHDDLTQKIAMAMEMRSVNSRSFLHSAGVCRAVCQSGQHLSVSNHCTWPGNLIWKEFAKSYPTDAKLVSDACLDLKQLELKIRAEIQAHRFELLGSKSVDSQSVLSPPKIQVGSEKWNDRQRPAVELAFEWLKVPSKHGGPARDQPRALRWLLDNGPSTHANWGTGAELDWSDDARDAARKMADRINKRARKYGETWEILPENCQMVTIEMIVPDTSRNRL